MGTMSVRISTCVLCVLITGLYGEELTIGVIIPEPNSLAERVVNFAVETINNSSDLLPGHTLRVIVNYSAINDHFRNLQNVCYLLKQGVTTVIGPMGSADVKTTHPMCLSLQVPQITPSATDPLLANPSVYEYLIRMSSSDSKQSEALVDFMKYFRWDTLAILTDSTDYGVNGVVKLQTMAAINRWRVLSVQQFTIKNNVSEIDVKQQLHEIKSSGARVVLLNCLVDSGMRVLEEANHYGMMGRGWVWVVTDGITGFNDMIYELNTHDYLKGLVGTRPSISGGSQLEDFIMRWQQYSSVENDSEINENFPVQEAYPLAFYDSVMVYARAMDTVLREKGPGWLTTKPLECWSPSVQPWSQGKELYVAMTEVEFDGVMSPVSFTETGVPVNASYDVVSLGEGVWDKHGVWNDVTGLQLNVTDLNGLGDMPLVKVRDYVGDIVNKTLRVVVVLEDPFVMLKDGSNASSCTSTDCFSGYAIDVLEELATELNFLYEIYIVADDKYGTMNEATGEWNGIVAELIPDKNGQTNADLAVGAITISYDREAVISFTKPYKDIMMGGLLAKHEENTYNPWSFLTPLSNRLWILMIGTAFAVATLISLLDKISPFGHYGKKAQVDNDAEHEAMDTNEDGTVDYWEIKEWRREKDTMSLSNASLWALASLFEQGGERHPKSWSARVAAGAWWLGALILVQSYTANLAAFLTIEIAKEEISTVEDLAKSSLKYGSVSDSQIQTYFDTSIRSPYSKMGHQMRTWDTFYGVTRDGVNAVVEGEGDFALLFDYPVLQYWKGQICSLKIMPNGYGSFGYGFGLPKDSLYSEELTIKIYQLRESGFTDQLDEKWLRNTAKCSEESKDGLDGETVRVTMGSLWGIFWIVYGSIGISFLALVVEWILSALLTKDSPGTPQEERSFAKLLCYRLQAMKKDILENWLFCNFGSKSDGEETMRPMPAEFREFVLAKKHAEEKGMEDFENIAKQVTKDVFKSVNGVERRRNKKIQKNDSTPKSTNGESVYM